MWAEMKFPPINLYNVWPTEEAANIHASTQDPTLWDDYEEDKVKDESGTD